eukprot:gene34469-46254_t
MRGGLSSGASLPDTRLSSNKYINSFTSLPALIPSNKSSGVTNSAGTAANVLAGERWDIEKTRRTLNASIEMEYEQSLSKILDTQASSNLKGVEVYKKIHNRVRLGHPPLPNPYKKAVLRYCQQLLSQGTDKYRTLKDGEEPLTIVETELAVWLEKSMGTQLEKLALELDTLCRHLFRIVDRRDDKIQRTQVALVATAERLTVKKENQLRWKMHTNFKNDRERFFSIWFLADNSKLREMNVLIDTTPPEKVLELVNSPDNDFGLTPLHYAAKRESLEMVKYLLSKG